ncbi:MAG: sigma-54-dependent transcriptional regulator [Isosphaeraceae bacterium]
MPMAGREKPLVVVADDDVHFLKVMEHHIGRWSYRARGVTEKAALLRELDREPPDLLLMDVRFGEHDGVEVLRQVIAKHPGLKVLMLTAFGSIDGAIAAIKLGALDYLGKPVDLPRLRAALSQVLERAEVSRQELEAPIKPVRSPTDTGTRPIRGESRAVRQLRDRIAAVAPTDATVLILGESGTGKELVARSLHERGRRAAGPFVALNVAAMPRELVESTLFGHENGSFTGADQAQRGACEAADGGTLFLDEIGEMEVNLQAKLLRFLQERSFQRVGHASLISVNVRIVAATHRDPLEQVRKGLLREDLYYRLNVVPIHVPPLRERREDVPLLAEHFLRAATGRLRREDLAFAPEALEALARYDWPGNVRQLENLVERLAIFGQGGVIGLDAVRDELRDSASVIEPRGDLVPPTASPVVGDESLSPIDRMEKHAIMEALRRTNGKVREAALALGLGQATVYRKIKRYGISPE